MVLERDFVIVRQLANFYSCGQKTRRGPSPPEQSRFLFLINVSVSAAFN
jgi:hypothetical protein